MEDNFENNSQGNLQESATQDLRDIESGPKVGLPEGQSVDIVTSNSQVEMGDLGKQAKTRSRIRSDAVTVNNKIGNLLEIRDVDHSLASALQDVSQTQEILGLKQNIVREYAPEGPKIECVISTVQMQPYMTNASNKSKIGRSQILPEGGTEDQSIVDASQRLNLNGINSGSFSESLSSQESDMSNRQGEEAATPKKQKKVPKNSFERHSIFNSSGYQGFQILIGVAYFSVCLVGVLAHMTNYQQILSGEEYIVAKPSSVQGMQGFEKANKIIKAIDITEIVLLAIIVIDLIVKLTNHVMVLKSNFSTSKQSEDEIYFDEPLTFDPFKNNGGQFLIKTEFVVMDAILVVLTVILYLIQIGLSQSGDLNYLHIGILMMVRAYFKIPFSIAIMLFIAKLKEIRHSQNAIFPKKQVEDFKSYKEKVLFIITSIRKQFGKRIYNSQPNFDLAWVTFVIENDYLQISNSISCDQKLLNFSQQNTQDYDEDKKPKKNRRFSKTIQTHFGQRNKNFVENLVMSENFKLAQECVDGTYQNPIEPELSNFNEYFKGFNYDAYMIDKSTGGNLLYFTLMYTHQKFDWQSKISGLGLQQFKNLAYRLQMSYRRNFYHSQVHAADVVQNLTIFFDKCDVKELCGMTDNDIFFSLLSGAAHDMDHPGTNNAFEVKMKSKLALLYNDQSVLEHHHAASFFFLLDNVNYDCNIMNGFSKKDQVEGRKMILENILGTDMTKHGAILNEVKAIAALPENERLMGEKNKAYMLKALVHAADIGNPTRPFDIAKKWGVNIVKEFFHQGDKEKALGIEISFGCDRSTSNFAKSQIGFFDFMIYPYYSTLTTLIPKMEPLAAQIKTNVEEYKNLVDEYEVAMKEGNLEF